MRGNCNVGGHSVTLLCMHSLATPLPLNARFEHAQAFDESMMGISMAIENIDQGCQNEYSSGSVEFANIRNHPSLSTILEVETKAALTRTCKHHFLFHFEEA